jgi:glycine/D-amino acid oxidase-like deaminating enzyme
MGSPKRVVVICGGGAIGAAIAYFVSLRGARAIVIERYEVAGAASGKSGGFLALDWCQGSPLDRLARRSFALHGRLSSDLGDPWGYRPLTTYSGYAAADDTARGKREPPWLSAGVTITSRLGSVDSTAVIEPRSFTAGLMGAAHARGAMLRNGTVVDLVRRKSGAVRGVALATGEIVEGDAVVIAMGPWSVLAARWLPLPAVLGYKGHSLVFETGGAIPAEALFLEYREASGEILPPSFFREPMAKRGCVRSRAPGRCRSILPMLRLMRVRTRGSKRCVGISRQCSPRRLSKRGRRASGPSAKTVCPSSAPSRVLTVRTWRLATVCGACSTRLRPARQ